MNSRRLNGVFGGKKVDFKWLYGGMAVQFTMIPSQSKTQVIIDNLPFFCFPLVILLSTVNFQVETHSEGRNVLFCFPLHTTIHLLAKRVSSAQILPVEQL